MAEKHTSRIDKEDERIDGIIKVLERAWIKELDSEGSNNSITLAGVKQVFAALNRVEPFTKESVFLDLGSGAGIPCIYAALKYNIPAYGIEIDYSLVRIASEFARRAGVSHLVTFYVQDVAETTVDWYREKAITHIYSYDVVFNSGYWEAMFVPIEQLSLIGATTKRFKSYWPPTVELIETVNRVMLAGGRSGFAFGIWRNVLESARRDASAERD